MRAALAAIVALVIGSSATGPTLLFRLSDPELAEVSGIAPGIVSPDVFYVQNDSGDSARFFALDAKTGRVRAEYRVPGARNVDWEDIAVAPDARGVPSVWLADIGDNDAERAEVDVYRVDEPHVPISAAAPVETSRPEVWRLRYPDGPRDAESLAVARGGAAYVISKSLTGDSHVYRLPAHADPAHIQQLTSVGSIRFTLHRVGTPRETVGQLAATGAALSADGTVLAVRTYSDAYVWQVHDADLAAAVRTPPVRVALPAQPQGEGIAVSGARLVVSSEGVNSAVYAVAFTPPGIDSTSAATRHQSGPLVVSAPKRSGSGMTAVLLAVAVGGAVLLLALGGLFIRRGRRARRL